MLLQPPDVIIKLLGIVNCYLSRHSKIKYYVLLEKSFQPHWYYVDQRLCFYPLGNALEFAKNFWHALHVATIFDASSMIVVH
jgi:hypothetical protein